MTIEKESSQSTPSGNQLRGSTTSSRATATAIADTSDWPQRLAVYVFDIDGYEMLSKEQQRICEDAAEWARQRIGDHSDSAVSAGARDVGLGELLDRWRNAIEWMENCPAEETQGAADAIVESRRAIESLFNKLEGAILSERRFGLDLSEKQRVEIRRLMRFETYVCQVIAMGNQADLTVEELPK
jgi:hypothetical protein